VVQDKTQHLFDAVIQSVLLRIEDQIWMYGFLIRRGYARIVLDFAFPCQFVQSLHIALFTNFKRTADIYFKELAAIDNFSYSLTVGPHGRNKSRQTDNPGIQEESEHFRDTPVVFGPAFRRKA